MRSRARCAKTCGREGFHGQRPEAGGILSCLRPRCMLWSTRSAAAVRWRVRGDARRGEKNGGGGELNVHDEISDLQKLTKRDGADHNSSETKHKCGCSEPPCVADDVVADIPMRQRRRFAHRYKHRGTVQYAWIADSRLPDSQLVQPAAFTAHCTHDVLNALVANLVDGEEENTNAAAAGG